MWQPFSALLRPHFNFRTAEESFHLLHRKCSFNAMKWTRWFQRVWYVLSFIETNMLFVLLTHWGRVTHICVSKLTIIGSFNGLSPDRHQAIIWTNAGLLLIGPLGTNFNEILIEIPTFSFKKRRLEVSSAKRRPFCLGLIVLSDLLCQFW